MAARWIPDPKVGGSNPSSFIPSFFLKKKCKQKELPKLGIAPRLPRPQRGVLLLDYFGGWRQMEDPGIDPGSQPCEGCMLPCTTIPHASIGTRTRILTLEGLNTTLVLWTLGETVLRSYPTRAGRSKILFCAIKNQKSGRGDLNSRPKDHCVV